MLEDVTRVLVDHFDLEHSVSGLSKGPYCDPLLSFLLKTEIDNPAKLKLHLRDNEIAPDCQEEFARFSTSFPKQVNIESFLLQHIKFVKYDQVEQLWRRSYLRRFPVGVFMRGTSGEIGTYIHHELEFPSKIRLPLAWGYEGLTMICCMAMGPLEGLRVRITTKMMVART